MKYESNFTTLFTLNLCFQTSKKFLFLFIPLNFLIGHSTDQFMLSHSVHHCPYEFKEDFFS